MKSTRIILLLMAVVFMTGGCISRALKEGVGAVKGAKGVYREVDRTGSLAAYQNFEVASFTDNFGGRAPQALLSKIPVEIKKQLKEDKLPVGKVGKTLLIRGTVDYFEKAGATGQAFGPFEEAITTVELVDKTTDKVIGQAICIGRSTQTVNMGLDKKAQGVAKAVVKWIKSKRPKEGKK